MKINYKHMFVAVIILFGFIVIVSSVSACVPVTPIDDILLISKNPNVKNLTISNNTKGGINGAVEKSESGDIIYLKKGVYRFNNVNIKINKNLTIIGKGSAKKIVIDARVKGRIFNISKNGQLKLVNVTIKNGFVSSKYSKGGAIYNKGFLLVNKCIFIKNHAKDNEFSYGGGIYNYGSLKVKNSIFKNCIAYSGGAIYCSAVYPTHIYKCKFINNKATEGSAIHNDFDIDDNLLDDIQSKIILKRSYFKNCGIYNEVENSLITNNKFHVKFSSAIENFCEKATISFNTIIGRKSRTPKYYGIDLFLSNNINVHNNKIYGFFDAGIYIVGVKNNVFKNQIYGKNRGVGIWLDYYHDSVLGSDISKYNNVRKNKVVQFKYGIYAYKGLKTNKISYNKLIKNNIGLASSYKFKNMSNIFKGNKKNIIKIKK